MRQRLVLATLSGKPVKIKGVRSKDDNPGLKGIYQKCLQSVYIELLLLLKGKMTRKFKNKTKKRLLHLLSVEF